MTEPQYITDPKLCRDCRWAKNTMPDYKPSNPDMLDYVWYCQHVSATRQAGPPSPITGAVRPAEQISCVEARGYGDLGFKCGPGGKFWEPIEAGFGPVEDKPIAMDNHRHLIPDTVTYDPEADVLFMGGDGVDTEAEEILPGVILLMDAHDRVTGIEITTASRLLKAIKPC